MRMSCRPRQHGAGYAEIVVLPGQAFINNVMLACLGLESHELLISLSTHRPVHYAHLIGLQFPKQEVEEMGSADGVDQHRAMADRPPFKLHAVAVAADVKPDHPPAKR